MAVTGRRRARTEGRACASTGNTSASAAAYAARAGITCAVPLTIPLHPSPVVSLIITLGFTLISSSLLKKMLNS